MTLECIVSNAVWHVQQPVKFGPISLTTRMTVVRLGDGALWIHSPVSPTDTIVSALQSIGRVRYVVAPNKSHHLFFLEFLKAFPEAEGSIAKGLESKRADLAGFPHIPRPAPWSSEIQGFFIEGLPILNETAWFHVETGTLILTDLLFCFSKENRGLARLISKILGVHETLGMSRAMKLAIKSRQDFAASISPLLSLPVQRVVVAHDKIVDDQPVKRIEQAFAWLR